MRLQLIQLPNEVIAVSDEEIKKGDLFLLDNTLNKWIKTCSKNDDKGVLNTEGVNNPKAFCKKIIASSILRDNLSLIDLSQLKDDVEKLADNNSLKFKRNDELDSLILGVSANSFIDGYKAHSETHKFTEEHLIKAMEYASSTNSNYQGIRNYIEIVANKSLNQLPKWIEVGTEEIDAEEAYKNNDGNLYNNHFHLYQGGRVTYKKEFFHLYQQPNLTHKTVGNITGNYLNILNYGYE